MGSMAAFDPNDFNNNMTSGGGGNNFLDADDAFKQNVGGAGGRYSKSNNFLESRKANKRRMAKEVRIQKAAEERAQAIWEEE